MTGTDLIRCLVKPSPKRSLWPHGHLVVIECPFTHEANLFRNDAIENEFGVVGATQILLQKRINPLSPP